jgi:hypothetical protein
VIGDDAQKYMAIYAGRTPDIYTHYADPNAQVSSDERQIIYWFVQGSGLYRRERPWVTNSDVNTNIDMDVTATETVLLSSEVTAATFEFSDGSEWYSSWDGTSPGPDGVTPQGAPRAVRLTLTFQFPVPNGQPITRQIVQVIAVRGAPGMYTPPQIEPATDGGDNSPSSSTGSSGGSTGGSTTSSTGGASGAKTGGTTAGGATGKTGGTTGTGAGGATGGKTGGTTGGTSGGSMGTTGGTGGGATGGTGGRAGGTTGGAGGAATGGGK